MSSHTYTLPRPPSEDQLTRLEAEATAAGRPINFIQTDGNSITISFTPDLSVAEVSALDDVIRALKTDLTRQERNAIQSDIDLLVTFQGLATPTNAQVVAAIKAQSRILRALLRS